MSKQDHFRFKRTDTIGAADAIEDEHLASVFVDGGELGVLNDCDDARSVVLGRTGSGKTALLKMLAHGQEHVINLDPQTLSLNHVSNSNILQFLESIGVKLDIFYELLWRHVLVIELLKYKYEITNEDKQRQFLSGLRGIFDRDNGKRKGIEYVQNWADKFWIETETTIREITRRLETDVEAAVGGSDGLPVSLRGACSISDEDKASIRERCKTVVNRVQIKELNNVLQLLADDIFTDTQKRYFVIIDDLDLGWAQEDVRLDLIIALLKTIKTFRKIGPVKIAIALRTDLHDLVLARASARDKGFQQEKYRSYYINLQWKKRDLEELLDKRVGHLAYHRYKKSSVKLSDVLPSNRPNKVSAIDYILERTQLRPREAILYLNACVARAAGASKVSWRDITDAETDYSRERYNSLIDEWSEEFPLIACYLKILEGRGAKFKLQSIQNEEIEDFKGNVFEYIGDFNPEREDSLRRWIEAHNSGQMSDKRFLARILHTLYRIGAIGIRLSTTSGVLWSFDGPSTLSSGQLKPTSDLYVHPSLHRAMHI